jgi:L-iditol 2-dehydrogenase
VTQVGPGVDRVVVGDRVVGDCRVGANEYFGLTFDGSGAEFFKARQDWLHKVPAEFSWTQAALVEPFTVAYYALHIQGGTDASEWVAILGGGTIGLCCLAAAKGMGARTILIEPSPERRSIGAGMGADVVVDPRGGSLEDTVNEATGGRGADLVLEASGAGAALASTLRIVGQFGRITFIGFNIGEQVSSQLGLIQSKDLSIKGITGSTGVWPKAIRFMGTARIDLSPLVSSHFRLEQGDAALEQVRKHAAGIKAHIAATDSN